MISRSGRRILIMLLVATFMIPFAIMTESANAETRWTIPSDATEFNGHYYKVYEITYSWQEAKTYCKSLGGHLMTITSQEEQDLATRLPIKSRTNYWIGATDEKAEGNWKWVTGEKWSFTAWAPNQPDNTQLDTGIDEDYLQLCTDWNARWNDSANVQDDTAGIGFICEWDSQSVSKPTNLKATQPALNQIKLTWKAGNNAKKYDIYRAKGSSGSFIKVGSTKKLYYTDKKVKNGNVYRYRVTAVNGGSSANSAVVYAYPMDKPKSVKATCDGLGTITVTWKKVRRAEKYLVYERRPDDVSFAKVTTVTSNKAEIKMTGGNGKYKYYIYPAVGSFMGLKSNTASVNATATVYRALVIGQTYFWNFSINTLDACKNDMKAMKNMLKNLEGTKYTDIKTLKDAKKSAILDGIDEIFGKADEDDVTLFYYSGHGQGENGTSNGALIGSDGETITPSELRRKLDQYKGKKVIILDSCHSGAMIGRNQNGLNSKGIAKKINASFIQAFSSNNENRASNYLGGSEYFVITACKGRQLSIAFKKYSLFTACFVDGCGWDEINSERTGLNADRNGDGKLTFKEAFIYSRDESNQIESEYNTAHAAAIAAGTEDPIDVDVQVYPTSSEVFFSR